MNPPSSSTIYRWLRPLGRGASSEVWAVERDGEELAVKVMRSVRPRSPFVEAMRREARIGELVRDVERAVTVRRVVTDNGMVFLEMDWVRGPSLEQVLVGRAEHGRGPVPSSVAVSWMIEVLQTLDEVARRVAPERPLTFVHRDIKPANLLIRPDGAVCITDFGVATAAVDLGFESTAAGTVKGSPRFMAPEMLISNDQDGRADQFSVGLVLYELVTGHPFYEAENFLSLVGRVAAADTEEILQTMPGELGVRAVLRRMLSRRPEYRYPNGRDAAAALAGLQLEGPTASEMLGDLLTHARRFDVGEVQEGEAGRFDVAATTMPMYAEPTDEAWDPDLDETTEVVRLDAIVGTFADPEPEDE